MIAFKELENGFTYIDITTEKARAKIAMQGAHLFHYEHSGETPFLWISEASDFTHGKAIRGGIPVCWPWFGVHPDASLPQHGFARTSMWDLVEARDIDSDNTEIILRLQPSEQTLELWPYHFDLQLHITIGDTLAIALSTTNLDEKPFELASALHTYFVVSQIGNVRVEGLDGKPYFDALSKTYHMQAGDITIDKEVDRVYQKVGAQIRLVDLERTITIDNEGSDSVIVWNPWIEKCAKMSAMKPDSFKTMLCIESANAMEDVRTLQPNETHTLRAVIA